MENASRALIIAGEVLIGLLIISIGVYLVIIMRQPAETYMDEIEYVEVTRFNVTFERLLERQDVSIQEILTSRNFARAMEERVGPMFITITGIGTDTITLTPLGTPELEGSNARIAQWNAVTSDEEVLQWGIDNAHPTTGLPPTFRMEEVRTPEGESTRRLGRITRIRFIRTD